MKTSQLTRIAMMTATVVVGRLLFSGIPNVQPMTALLILYAIKFGIKEGWLLAMLSLLVSNMYLGLGPWTFAQMIGYTVIIMGTWLVQGLQGDFQRYILAIYGLTAGLAYGMIMAVVHGLFFGWPLVITYYISGIPFDVMHAGGNIGFILLLYPIVHRLFRTRNTKTVLTTH